MTALVIAAPGRLRDGLRVLLRASATITHIVHAEDRPSGLRQMAECRPDVVLFDADLLNGEGWQMVRQIRQDWPQCGCVVLTHTARQERLARLNGATALLPDGFTTETLSHIITQR